ncbi:MAG: aminoacyl-tRNA hydrolase [bacterium]
MRGKVHPRSSENRRGAETAPYILRTEHKGRSSSVTYIIGLGNPGLRYRNTRHNIGFLTADAFTARFNNILQKKRTRSASITELILGEHLVVVVKPLLYMNRSGAAVANLKDRLLAPENRTLVVYDDSSLPFAALRFRRRGSSGGHLGFQSIIENLKTDHIHRLRIGICGNINEPLEEYVLSPFNADERALLPEFLNRAAEAIETCILHGIDEAMNRFN